MKVLGRDELLSGASLKRELVPVPELQGDLWMRDIGAPGVMAFNNRIKELGEGREITAEISLELMTLLVSLSACDESGALIFSSGDVSKLAENNIDMLSRLGTKALEISGMKKDIINGLTSEVADNLPNALNSSPSDSPTNSRKRKRK